MLGGPWTRAGQMTVLLQGLRHVDRLIEIEARYREGDNPVRLAVPSREKLLELADAAYAAYGALVDGASPLIMRGNVRSFARGAQLMREVAEGAIAGHAIYKERWSADN